MVITRLMYLDLSHSLSGGFTFSISPLHSDNFYISVLPPWPLALGRMPLAIAAKDPLLAPLCNLDAVCRALSSTRGSAPDGAGGASPQGPATLFLPHQPEARGLCQNVAD